MSHHPNTQDIFYDYSLPTFLEGSVDINDEDLIIELGEGTFSLDFNLLFHQHNITIKGQGSTKTILNIPISVNYVDDAIIIFQGDWGHEISVSIHGLTINGSISKVQAETASNKIVQNESYLIKCYHAKSFDMKDVKFRADNLKTTCLDIRRGHNIIIQGNEFVNYNRRWTGGCIWLRGDIENATIEDNDFYKYGNDEVIALFEVNNFSGVNNSDEISKKNVNIRYNRFFCQDDNGGENQEGIITETGGRGTWHGCNERFITVFTNQDGNKEYDANHNLVQRPIPCHQTINGIHLYNNEFHINAPSSHLFTVVLDKYTSYKDISLRDNIIDYGHWTVDGNSLNFQELIDFGIYYDIMYDSSVIDGDYDGFNIEPFYITGNTIRCGSNIRNIRSNEGNSYYVDNHIIVDIKGTKVIFNDNSVLCEREAYTADEQNFANKGIELFYCGSKEAEVVFCNNHCEGLRALMLLTSSGTAIPKGRVWGSGNYLQGNPRIIFVNILESHVFMINNEIICDYPIFFLEEFADTGTAVFTGNRVVRDLSRAIFFTTAFGHIYYTGSQGYSVNETYLL